MQKNEYIGRLKKKSFVFLFFTCLAYLPAWLWRTDFSVVHLIGFGYRIHNIPKKFHAVIKQEFRSHFVIFSKALEFKVRLPYCIYLFLVAYFSLMILTSLTERIMVIIKNKCDNSTKTHTISSQVINRPVIFSLKMFWILFFSFFFGKNMR